MTTTDGDGLQRSVAYWEERSLDRRLALLLMCLRSPLTPIYGQAMPTVRPPHQIRGNQPGSAIGARCCCQARPPEISGGRKRRQVIEGPQPWLDGMSRILVRKLSVER